MLLIIAMSSFVGYCLSAMMDGERSVARPEEELGIEDREWSRLKKSLNAYTGLMTKN